MNQKIKFIGLFAILPLAMIALSPDFFGEADAMKSITGPQETGYTFSRTGALTEPFGEKPFGGDHVVGHYTIQANDHAVKINSEFQIPCFFAKSSKRLHFVFDTDSSITILFMVFSNFKLPYVLLNS